MEKDDFILFVQVLAYDEKTKKASITREEAERVWEMMEEHRKEKKAEKEVTDR